MMEDDNGQSHGSETPEPETRPAKPGETDTTRFGMEDGDNTDVPATGVDPEQQSASPPENGKAP